MARIIPWKLPDVQGGSVGGYTPAPTPTPLTNYPYDLDNLVATLDFDLAKVKQSKYVVGLQARLNLSGTVILDASEVSSVIATVGCSSGDAVFEHPNETTTTASKAASSEFTLDVTSLMTNAGGSVSGGDSLLLDKRYLSPLLADDSTNYCTLDSTTVTLTLVSIIVYNGNGIALQEWEPPEE